MAKKKLLIVDVAALGWNLVERFGVTDDYRKLHTVFPAVTCPVQASFRTGLSPSGHGVVSNGFYQRAYRKASFWEQSAALVEGERFWNGERNRGHSTGMMFWQQSLGESVSLILSPKPIHKHHGGMIQDCYAQPEDLYHRMCKATGRKFNLMHYWGPLASGKSSRWIADAMRYVMTNPELAPDILMGYLPHLDYDLQRHGPESTQAATAFEILSGILTALKETAEEAGYDWLIFGDYAIESVRAGAVYPNLILRSAGLMNVRNIRGMSYPDLFSSRAFAMVDHQIAHVYIPDQNDIPRVHEVLDSVAGIDAIFGADEQVEAGIAHPRAGELVLVASPGCWLAYPWWLEPHEEPEFASHVDIHNKPGYDPCELFFGWPPMSVSRDVHRVKGTHGRSGYGFETAWSTSCDFAEQPESLLQLSAVAKKWIAKAMK